MVKRLNRANKKNVFSYIDILRKDIVQIENVIQDLKKIKGLIVQADLNRISQTRNLLIKAQNKLSELENNLKKSEEFK